ncbi:LysM peptidoglycan-binding domain-containing protein [Treponema sp.]|uniref:Hsp70 family protein n=1 Tax=Treponema sp. TaxID=166 RepID=UPI00298DF013|nr:LysM peptidoglycan-binding domain-containing protein [Treponema sp.]
MKTIGIKLADGSFYPVLQEGTPEKKQLNLTTAKDNQTTVQVDLYRSETSSMEDAEYVDTLEIKHLKKHPNGEPDINLDISIDENNELNAELHDPETGKDSSTSVSLLSRTMELRNEEAQTDVTQADVADDDFDLDASLSNPVEETSFDSDEDISFDPNSLNVDSIVEEEHPAPVDDDFSMDDVSLDETVAEETAAEQDVSDQTVATDDVFGGDFAIDSAESNTETFDIPEESTPMAEDDFNVPEESEINFDETSSQEMNDVQETSDSSAVQSAGLDFSDILDEETKEGHAAESIDSDSSIKKKTKIPVLICIICAIICIIAVILIFAVRAKSKCAPKETAAVEKQEEPKTEEVKEEKKEKYEAKENEIVVAPAEEVVPATPKQSTKETSKNITYKIKWGDTLWDISKSYYNNPWKYHKIAKYNGIKNPDHIISGTTIIIPAE